MNLRFQVSIFYPVNHHNPANAPAGSFAKNVHRTFS